jgi:hypothetical protein
MSLNTCEIFTLSSLLCVITANGHCCSLQIWRKRHESYRKTSVIKKRSVKLKCSEEIMGIQVHADGKREFHSLTQKDNTSVLLPRRKFIISL